LPAAPEDISAILIGRNFRFLAGIYLPPASAIFSMTMELEPPCL
jgi:hypothetical protein